MKNFRDLAVWQKAHHLVLTVYRATASLPAEERYGLTNQLRRAAASIPANIAEGCGRGTDADFARFVQHAMASACELEYHLLLTRDLGLLDADPHQRLEARTTELKRMLTGLLLRLRAAR